MEENKEQTFLEEVASYLQSKNFVEEEPGLYKLQQTLRQPEVTMVINGCQQIQQPGQELIHTLRVEFFGPGAVGEDNTDREERFEIIRFRVEDRMGDKSSQNLEHMEGFYPGELNRFVEMLNKFGI